VDSFSFFATTLATLKLIRKRKGKEGKGRKGREGKGKERKGRERKDLQKYQSSKWRCLFRLLLVLANFFYYYTPVAIS
jgi:hypothetical protein